jgi:hypothetical protein
LFFVPHKSARETGVTNPRETRSGAAGKPTPIGDVLGALLPAAPPTSALVDDARRRYRPGVAAALVAPSSDFQHLEGRRRREIHRELERIIERCVWRAERRSRRVPWHVRRLLSWVMAERRTIAYEVMRALVAMGAGDQLARRLAELGALRFPRDGVVVDDRKSGPRLEGTNPRAVGDNPRASGANPRAVGTAPRQRRQRSRSDDDAQVMAAMRAAD